MNIAKQDYEIPSPSRRALLLAGAGGGAASVLPVTALAAISPQAVPHRPKEWILSGQVLHGSAGAALAGARVEIWSPAGSIDSIHTGPDGRFALSIRADAVRPDELDSLKYWVSHKDQGSFAAELGSINSSVQPARPHNAGIAGRLAANVGISLA